MKKIIIPIVIIILIAGAVVWFMATNMKIDLPGDEWKISEDKTYEPSVEADQQFGFLIGPSAEEIKLARETGAGWVRPHPGPFVWGDMQKSAGGSIDFSETDNMVKAAAAYDINILPTIWHYADWDQENHRDPSECINPTDEFNREFGKYRCIPSDWAAYTNWVTAIVERYDGDGINDMPNLIKPLTHWEIMNEPDLGTPDGSPGLTFLIGQPSDYAELLKKTSAAIRSANPNAIILIAGAAGGDEMFLDYFREVFQDPETIEAFDIANVHCISSGHVASFNVDPYAAMLAEFNIDKPIWVTEAEAFQKDSIGQRQYTLAEQLLVSSTNALNGGAEKIFFTSMNLDHIPGGGDKDKLPKKKEGPQASTDIYQNIFNSL